MRKWMIGALVGIAAVAGAQQPPKSTPTLKSVLLQELRETHNQKNWFVSEKEAAGGLTAEQAAWSDGKNHSVGQLVEHLNFWNSSNLARLQKEPAKKVDNNDDTFTFDPQNWDAAQQHFDQIMTQWEEYVQSADDAAVAKFAPTVARVAQHNAYHIAEMVTSRKKQGSWNPENGVK